MRSLRNALISIAVVATLVGAFILIDDTHTQTVGGEKTHVLPIIGGVVFSSLPASPTNGELQYCTDCLMPSHPCSSGGTGAMAARIDGAWECFPGGNAVIVTPTPQPTATPQPVVTPVPTDTPLIDLLYSGKLNLGANASGTPLGHVAITANATPAPHDRIIYCTSSLATPTPVIYTMPPATGTGRIIDMISAGSGYCEMNAGSDFMNDGHTEVFIQKWQSDTCYDVPGTTGQWACRNLPEPTPT